MRGEHVLFVCETLTRALHSLSDSSISRSSFLYSELSSVFSNYSDSILFPSYFSCSFWRSSPILPFVFVIRHSDGKLLKIRVQERFLRVSWQFPSCALVAGSRARSLPSMCSSLFWISSSKRLSSVC